jgi:hypothetical protein
MALEWRSGSSSQGLAGCRGGKLFFIGFRHVWLYRGHKWAGFIYFKACCSAAVSIFHHEGNSPGCAAWKIDKAFSPYSASSS